MIRFLHSQVHPLQPDGRVHTDATVKLFLPDDLDEFAHVHVVRNQKLGLVQYGKLLLALIPLNDHLKEEDGKHGGSYKREAAVCVCVSEQIFKYIVCDLLKFQKLLCEGKWVWPDVRVSRSCWLIMFGQQFWINNWF